MVFDNDHAWFVLLKKHLNKRDHCVIEASGTYFLKLAMFLYLHKVKVSVVNPLVVNRYMQMMLSRTKTDKKDAKMISEFGQNLKPLPPQMPVP